MSVHDTSSLYPDSTRIRTVGPEDNTGSGYEGGYSKVRYWLWREMLVGKGTKRFLDPFSAEKIMGLPCFPGDNHEW